MAYRAMPFDLVRVTLAVLTFSLCTRDVDGAYLIIGGGLLGAGIFYVL